MSRVFETKVSRDILYGDIQVPTKIMEHVVDKPTFQLLDWRKQLGSAHLIYRNAHHTRFEHSLGVFHLSNLLTRSLASGRRLIPVSDDKVTDGISPVGNIIEDEKLFSVSSLIHDIGNFPFCHQLERSLILEMPNHEQLGAMIVRGLFRNVDLLNKPTLEIVGVLGHIDNVADVINSKSNQNSLSPSQFFIREAISGPYGLDFLDYMARDSFYCGFSAKSIADFLIDHAVVLQDRNHSMLRLAFTQHVLHELISLAQQRLDLERKVYSNKTHKIVTAMLAHAVLAAARAGKMNIHELHLYTDDGLLRDLEDCDESKGMIQMLRSRNLYEVAYRFDAKKPGRDPSVARALELWGARQVQALREIVYSEVKDLDEEDILFSFPHPEERTCKEGEAFVVNLEDSVVRQLVDVDPWIVQYETEYANLRKYLILVSPMVSQNAQLAERVRRKLLSSFEEWVLEIQGIKQIREVAVHDRLQSLSDIQWGIMNLLLDRGQTAEELASAIGGRTRSTIGYHLAKLDQIGLVRKQRRGKKVVYGIASEYEGLVQKRAALIAG